MLLLVHFFKKLSEKLLPLKQVTMRWKQPQYSFFLSKKDLTQNNMKVINHLMDIYDNYINETK